MLLNTNSIDEVSICVENSSIKSNKCEKFLSSKIDNKLNINNYIMKNIKKTGQELNML